MPRHAPETKTKAGLRAAGGNPGADIPRLPLESLANKILSLTPPVQGVYLLLTDAPIIKRLVVEGARRHDMSASAAGSAEATTQVAVCSELSSLREAVDELASPPLFGAPSPLVVELPEKLTQAHLKILDAQMARVIEASRAPRPGAPMPAVWFLAKTALRRSLKTAPFLQAWLSYGPHHGEASRILGALIGRYPRLKGLPAAEKAAICARCVTIYDTDLLLADDHLSRMNTTGLAFDDVFTDLPMVGLFGFIDSLPNETPVGAHVRLEQCLQSGEDPGRILAALHAYFRQILRFRELIETGLNPQQAFLKMSIPFPAQAKITAGAKRFSVARIKTFLMSACDTELALRQSYRSADRLRVEFNGLLT